MSDSSPEIVIPKVLVVPSISGASLMTTAQPGTLVMSGAKLYVAVGVGSFQLITSA